MNIKAFAAAFCLVSASATFAQAPASTAAGKPAAAVAPSDTASCESQAVGKNGKPLTGAAKSSFIKKCEGGSKDTASASCETKAIDKNGKPLAGAAKTAFVKKCVADAGK